MTIKNQEKNQTINFVQNTKVIIKSRSPFGVYREDWQILRRMIDRYEPKEGAWYNFFWFCLAVTLNLLSALLTGAYKDEANVQTGLKVAVVSSVIIIGIILVVAKQSRNNTANNKKDIKEFMDAMEVKIDDEGAQMRTSIEPWTARPISSNVRGANYKKIDLRDINSLSFVISTKSNYWRAGFELSLGRPEPMPNLLVDKSFLFHIGRNINGEYVLTVYTDGAQSKNIILTNLKQESQDIVLSFERKKDGGFQCYVNNGLEYEGKLLEEYFKEAYMVAWGDGNEFEINFRDILFS